MSTTEGIRLYSTENFHTMFNRDFEGGVYSSAMLNASNMMALVVGGEPQTQVALWDDDEQVQIGQLSFAPEIVLRTFLTEEKLVAVFSTKVMVFSF